MPARLKNLPLPEVWATNIVKHLSGDEYCLWSVWFRTMHWFDKVPDDRDWTDHRFAHSDIIRRTVAGLTCDGYSVGIEDQNKFHVKGSFAALVGKPDIIALRGNTGLVIDAKSGVPHPSHDFQVMLYMWALPLERRRRFQGIKFDGKIIYRNNYKTILNADLPSSIGKRVGELIVKVTGNTAPARVPSHRECRFCKVAAADCPDRMDAEPVDDDGEADTDLF